MSDDKTLAETSAEMHKVSYVKQVQTLIDRITAALALPRDASFDDIALAVRQCTRRCEELEHHIARHFPARGSDVGDLTKTEEKLFDLADGITKIKLDLDDPDTREVWEAAKQAREEVMSWPAWKRGEK